MNDSSPQTELNVYGCITTAYKYAWANRHELVKLASGPVVLLSLIVTILQILFPGPIYDFDPEAKKVMMNDRLPIELLVRGIFYVMFAVAWHRKWLAPDEDITVAAALKWDGRKTRFFLRSILIFIFSALATIPMLLVVGFLQIALPTLGILGLFALFTVFFIAWARFSLWLPACAADDPVDLARIWFSTRGNSWRMVGVCLFPQLPIAVIFMVAQGVLGALLTGLGLAETMTGMFVFVLVSQAINYFGVAVAVSALSIAYLHFKAQVPEMTAEE